MMGELADEQNEEHEKAMLPYRGFPGSRPLPEHDRQIDHSPLANHAPHASVEAQLDLMADEVIEFDATMVLTGTDHGGARTTGNRFYFQRIVTPR